MITENGVQADAPKTDAELIAAHAAGDPEAFAELVRRHRDRMWQVALRTLGDPEEAADALQEAFISGYRAAASFRADAKVTTWLHRIVVNACLDRIRRRQVRPTVPLPETALIDPPEPRTLARESDIGEITGLLERSSLGTDAARSLRDRATPASVDRILQQAKDLAPTRDPLPAPAPQPDVHDPSADSDRSLVVRHALASLPDEQRAPIILVDMEGFSVAEVAKMLGIAEGTVKSRVARGRAKLAKALSYLRSADTEEYPRLPRF